MIAVVTLNCTWNWIRDGSVISDSFSHNFTWRWWADLTDLFAAIYLSTRQLKYRHMNAVNAYALVAGWAVFATASEYSDNAKDEDKNEARWPVTVRQMLDLAHFCTGFARHSLEICFEATRFKDIRFEQAHFDSPHSGLRFDSPRLQCASLLSLLRGCWASGQREV